jgi:hypothetical protein
MPSREAGPRRLWRNWKCDSVLERKLQRARAHRKDAHCILARTGLPYPHLAGRPNTCCVAPIA